MDDFLNPVWSSKPYPLSLEGDKHTVIIPNEVLKLCAKQDMFVLDYLYRSFKKGLNGIILNVEEDLSPELQISVFFGALNKSLKSKFLGLVLCPDDAITKWHYYLTQCGTLDIKILDSEIPPEDISENTGTVLLLNFSNMKLIESLMEYNFCSAVIDGFDQIATKMIIRKLQSNFNIGITLRNFYTQPDQKLQWTMLNWTNPGCVGKLADFYEDNYKEWWFRITWNFCDSFVRPTLAEKGNLNNVLREWAKEKNLPKYPVNNQGKRTRNTRKRKEKVEVQSEDSDSEKNNTPKRVKRVYTTPKNKNANKIQYNAIKETRNGINNSKSDSADDSSDTIIYGDVSQSNLDEVEDVEKEEPPIRPTLKESEGNHPANFSDNDSISSGEQLLLSFVSGKKPSSLVNTKRHSKQISSVIDVDDESDNFLKFVATKDNSLHKMQRNELSISELLSEGGSTNKNLSSIDLELSEQKILGTDADLLAESDSFLQEICSGKIKKDAAISSKESNYSRTSSSTSDVDSLVAEVMEMVGKSC